MKTNANADILAKFNLINSLNALLRLVEIPLIANKLQRKQKKRYDLE